MTRKNLLVSYALDFVSFILSEKYIENYEIRNIILYGSAARGDFKKESDVDVFVDVIKSDKIFEDKIKNSVKYFKSSIWHKKWDRFGVKNEISLLVGNLDKWVDLKRSIAANGIVLYGNYKTDIKGKMVTLFNIENLKPESKRVSVYRKLFGYKKYGAKHEGLVEKYKGEKISKGSFIVPIENHKKILSFLRENKVKINIREISIV